MMAKVQQLKEEALNLATLRIDKMDEDAQEVLKIQNEERLQREDEKIEQEEEEVMAEAVALRHLQRE